MQDELDPSDDRPAHEGPARAVLHRLHDRRRRHARTQATLARIVTRTAGAGRMVRVEVRVGDYARDSSRFVSFDRDPGVASMLGMGVVEAPLDDDVECASAASCGSRPTPPTAGRSSACTRRSRPRCRTRSRPIPCPTGPVRRRSERMPSPRRHPSHRSAWSARRARCRPSSPGRTIASSNVALTVVQGTRLQRQQRRVQDGLAPPVGAAAAVRPKPRPTTACRCATRTAALARTVDRLPAAAELASGPRRSPPVSSRCARRRWATSFTGPVLVEGQAASELLAQTLRPAVSDPATARDREPRR